VRITYDPQVDALNNINIRFSQREGAHVQTKRVDEDIPLDLDEEEKLHGIGFLSASHRVDLDWLLKVYVPLAHAQR
jgi:uncharacterized protein YuzE